MVETQSPRGRYDYGEGLRPQSPASRPAQPGRSAERVSGPRGAPRQRMPSLRELAALVVDGMLVLPRHYRRGMFLDITV
jgi:hypothetical protein